MKFRSPPASTPLPFTNTPGGVCPFYIRSENLNSDLHTGMLGTLSINPINLLSCHLVLNI